MSKQDRQGVRTPADIERKYALGQFEEVSKNSTKQAILLSQLDQKLAQYIAKTNAVIDELKGKVEAVYPVGSIYISVNSTSPATLFGGTWERIQDTFLLAAGSSYAAGSTGGEATHTLLSNEMPKVTGRMQFRLMAGSNIVDTYSSSPNDGCFTFTRNGGAKWNGQSASGGTATTNTDLITFDNGGQNQPHNNMPPYLAVYVWKRTA